MTKKVIHFLLTGVACLFFFTLSAQDADSVQVKKPKVHSPAKAMLYSAICPGLGQIYNKKYWKLSIIYGGLGTAAYFAITNTNYYKNYYNALAFRTNGGIDQYYNIYSSSELSTIVAYYRRNVDLTYIIAAGIYLLQIVDANVDAQMHGFNVSDDISLHFSPNLMPNPMTGTMCFQPGFKLVKRF
ncbi:MAG TPA: DUF5683 domain-containing protein [Bacteroidia bacterium]|nr:DUF5683 domain-containing protein [Bacteroidia bacterium]